MHRTLGVVLSVGLFVSSEVRITRGGDWPAFRGPNGNGWSSETGVPTTWSASKNVKWKAPLPEGNSSPVVTGDRVFVTVGEDEGRNNELRCYARDDGKLLWSKAVEFDKVLPTHKTNPYCAPTPATDGKRVVVWYGSAGLFCYDVDGKELWNRRDLGEFKHVWGYAVSPVIYQDRVIQNCAPGKPSFIAAFNVENGRDLWRVEEPTEGDGENRKGGGWMGTWSTPLVAKLGGQDQIVCSQPTRVVSYLPKDGRILWMCKTENRKGELAYSSPIVSDGVCISSGGFSGGATAFKLGGSGDLSNNKLWYKPQNPQSIGTGVVVDGYLYIPDAGPGTIRCLKADTGEEQWTERTGNFWGSIVMAEGRAYVTNQDGATIVFKPNPEKFELIAKNELGEHCNGTPAVSNGQIFIRTFENLYCIQE